MDCLVRCLIQNTVMNIKNQILFSFFGVCFMATCHLVMTKRHLPVSLARNRSSERQGRSYANRGLPATPHDRFAAVICLIDGALEVDAHAGRAPDRDTAPGLSLACICARLGTGGDRGEVGVEHLSRFAAGNGGPPPSPSLGRG